jgi:hypothetical protein
MKTCLKCGKEFEPSKGLINYCSLQCRNSRERTKEFKEKLSKKTSKAWEDGIIYKQLSLRKAECWEERKCLNEKCENIFKVMKHQTKKFCCYECAYSSSYFKNLKSQHTIKSYLEGRKIYGGTTKWYNVETSNGVIRVQGTYEVRVCKILDKWKRSGKIKNWEYTKDKVEYLKIDQTKHLYLLDFKIWNKDESFYYIEVKGYKTDNDLLKWEAVKNKGLKLEIWFEKEIKINEEGLEVNSN